MVCYESSYSKLKHGSGGGRHDHCGAVSSTHDSMQILYADARYMRVADVIACAQDVHPMLIRSCVRHQV